MISQFHTNEADISDSITFNPRPEGIVEAAYWTTPDSSITDITKVAYERALQLFKQENGNDEAVKAWLQSKASIKDIKRNEESAPLAGWAFAQCFYFGRVLDTLAQHHPEYVALAWGAIKFVPMGIMQRGELLEKLAKALTLIGDVLPEVELSANFYKIDKMEKALGLMYFNIILFFWRAFRCYNKSPASRVFESFASPCELKYKDVVERIKECSINIELIASGASRAELRSVNVQVHLVKRDQQHLQRTMDEMRSQMEVVLKYVQGTHSMTQQVHTRVEDIHPRIYDLQYSQIIAHLTPSVDPLEMLRKGQSLVRRRQQKYGSRTRPASPVLNGLNSWALSSGCSLIILQAEASASIITKDLAVSVIDHLQHAGCKIFWTMSYSGNTAAQPSVMSILKSLIFQAARDDPKVLTGMPDHLNIAKFTSAHSEEETVDLLSLILSKMGQCFIVVESEELCRLLSEDLEASRRFFGLFSRLTERVDDLGAKVKVLVVNFGLNLGSDPDTVPQVQKAVTAVKRPAPIPKRLQRPGRRGRGGKLLPL